MSSLKTLALGLLLISGTSGCCLLGHGYPGMYGYPMGGGCNTCPNGACGPIQGGMLPGSTRSAMFAQPVQGTQQLVLIDPGPTIN